MLILKYFIAYCMLGQAARSPYAALFPSRSENAPTIILVLMQGRPSALRPTPAGALAPYAILYAAAKGMPCLRRRTNKAPDRQEKMPGLTEHPDRRYDIS